MGSDCRDFLLTHDNCWIAEGQMFPDHGLLVSPPPTPLPPFTHGNNLLRRNSANMNFLGAAVQQSETNCSRNENNPSTLLVSSSHKRRLVCDKENPMLAEVNFATTKYAAKPEYGIKNYGDNPSQLRQGFEYKQKEVMLFDDINVFSRETNNSLPFVRCNLRGSFDFTERRLIDDDLNKQLLVSEVGSKTEYHELNPPASTMHYRPSSTMMPLPLEPCFGKMNSQLMADVSPDSRFQRKAGYHEVAHLSSSEPSLIYGHGKGADKLLNDISGLSWEAYSASPIIDESIKISTRDTVVKDTYRDANACALRNPGTANCYNPVNMTSLMGNMTQQENGVFSDQQRPLSSGHCIEELIWKCPVCNKDFTTEDGLKYHMKVHSDQLSCCICMKSFSTLSNLIRHWNALHNNIRYSCDLCSKQYKHPGNWKAHMRRHSQVIESTCTRCQNKFIHDQSKSLSRKVLCKTCLEHESYFRCQFCMKEFQQRSGLISHQKTDHHQEIKAHMRRHSQVIESTCTRCQNKFIHDQSKSLSRKVLCKTCLEHESYFRCQFCMKEFQQRSGLISHQKTDHHREIFTCDKCGKPFTNKSTFSLHMKRHVCGKGFVRKYDLEQHKRLHSDTKIYKCGFCGKPFKQKNSRYRHEKTCV